MRTFSSDISGTDTGMHLYVSVHNGMMQQELLDSAMENDVKVYGTSRMWFSKPAPENNVTIGFSAISFDDIAPGISLLAKAWFQKRLEHRERLGGTPAPPAYSKISAR